VSRARNKLHLWNSTTIRTCADEAPEAPGVIEADTVAHCGPTLIGEFARTQLWWNGSIISQPNQSGGHRSSLRDTHWHTTLTPTQPAAGPPQTAMPRS
jgi:hypothetical protein